MPAIEVKGLSKSFSKGAKALDGVSFIIEPGEMVALIGASGSGKSTLLRHIAGLIPGDRADGCRVNVLGKPMLRDGSVVLGAGAARRDIGFVFQRFNLVDRLSVMTNVLVGALPRVAGWRGYFNVFPGAEKQLAARALERVGILKTVRQRASTLSGGQQQRAAIARALVQQAKVILADEPIASLDPVSSRRVMETIASVNREDGITVIVSLHQVEYAINYCPRTIALHQGKVLYDGPSTALTHDFLRELYGAEGEELMMEGVSKRPAPGPADARPAFAPAYAALAE